MVLSHQCWVPATSAWGSLGPGVSLCNHVFPTLAPLSVEQPHKPLHFPAQPATAQLIGSTFSFFFCSIPKHDGFAQHEPIAYHFWALHVYFFSRQILVQVFTLLLSRAKDNGPSCHPKNPWLCLDHTPQPHPVSGLKPGAERATSTMYTGRRNDSKVLPATLH